MPEHNSMTSAVGPKPLLCRFNLRHDWQVESSPDGERYVRCAKCGKDRNEKLDIPIKLL